MTSSRCLKLIVQVNVVLEFVYVHLLASVHDPLAQAHCQKYIHGDGERGWCRAEGGRQRYTL
jgi:hypothetical protein